MMNCKEKLLLFFIFLIIINYSFSQSYNSYNALFDEVYRREQFFLEKNESFLLRPLKYNFDSSGIKEDKIYIKALPIFSTSRFNSKRQYGWGDFGLASSVGLQSYFSTGFRARFLFLNLEIQPEFIFNQNKPFFGYSNNFPDRVNRDRFLYFNHGDYPELFGDGAVTSFWWGQSKLSMNFGPIELGVSTKNIWWGPGQWNSLTFSNNSRSFPHLTLNTNKPIKTLLGNFETQIIIGRLEDSGFLPTQHSELNNQYFRPFSGDWRYLNALLVSYSPKWINGLSVGLARTFQQYNETRSNRFSDIFPIFEAFQKERFLENGNSVEFDSDGRDQQASVFARFVSTKANAEVYFEYGRRDHALNWREFILNPEHARAYLFGFSKLFQVINSEKFIQIRGEITHQQQSFNRIMRYSGVGGGSTWHTHNLTRGFANQGQALGVGIGTGSNIQTIEIALVEKFNKIGVLFERLENHQDFYYRSLFSNKNHKPWIDLSVGLLFDKQWNNLIMSSKVQFINGRNYQWQLSPNSTPDFPQGQNLFSVHSQVSLIYLPKGLKRSQKNL